MTLLEYIKSLTADELSVFANTVGTSVGYINQAAYGYKNIGPDFALRLEKASGRKVLATDLCPGFSWDLAKQALCECAK